MLEMTEQLSIRDRASAALRAAMRARDTEAVVALRTLLGERLELSEAELVAIARREHEELARSAEHADALGAHTQADSRRRRRDVVAGLLDG